MADDVIDDLVRQLLAAAPELPAQRVEAIAHRIRHDWGGNRVYIRKAQAEGKAFRLGSALAAGVPLNQALDDLQVSRATGFRLMFRLTRRR